MELFALIQWNQAFFQLFIQTVKILKIPKKTKILNLTIKMDKNIHFRKLKK